MTIRIQSAISAVDGKLVLKLKKKTQTILSFLFLLISPVVFFFPKEETSEVKEAGKYSLFHGR